MAPYLNYVCGAALSMVLIMVMLGLLMAQATVADRASGGKAGDNG